MNTRCIIIMSLGVISMFSGAYLYFEWISIFTQLRGQQMALSPHSRAYAGWKVTPFPLYLDVYLFNWTNPEDFYVGSPRKAHFKQLGPYKFREMPEKVNIVWHASNYSVSFRKKTKFHFEADLSKGSLEDRITTVNTIAHAAAVRCKESNAFKKLVVERVLRMSNEEVAITKTANEWLFKGYNDPLLTVNGLLSMFSKTVQVPYDRFGWLYGRNDSAAYDGHFNMYTGADDIAKMGSIHTWNYNTQNGFFKGKCDGIKGSMGEFFPPNLSPQDSLLLHVPNICRTIELDYTETVKVHGVTAYKFSASKRVLDNGTDYPQNKCFFINDQCERSGVFNIGPCKYNASFYMSFPHFYEADPYYLRAVEGLQPDPEKHEMFLAVEPNTGIPMAAGGGFQANYLLEPIKNIRPFDIIPRTFIPIMWAEQRVTVTAAIANDLSWVPFLVLCGHTLSGILLALGVILFSCYPIKMLTCNTSPKRRLLKCPTIKSTHNAKDSNDSKVKHITNAVEHFPLMEHKAIVTM